MPRLPRLILLVASSLIGVLPMLVASCTGSGGTQDAGTQEAGSDVDDRLIGSDAGRDARIGDSAADAPEAGFRPTELGGLALWLDPAVGVTADGLSLVSEWKDRSMYGHRATAPSPGARPTYVPASGPRTAALRFNGSTNFLEIATHDSFSFGSSDFVVAVVARHTTSGEGWFYGRSIQLAPSVILRTGLRSTANGIGALEGFVTVANPVTSPSTGYNNGGTFLLTLERRALVARLRVNGVEVSSNSTGGDTDLSPLAGAPILLGAQASFSGPPTAYHLNGDLVEIVIVKGVTSSQELTALEGYLRARHSLP